MRDGGVKNLEKLPTSFMDGPQEEDEKAAVSCFCG